MDQDFFLKLAKDVGEVKANTERLIESHNQIVPVINEHSQYIGQQKQRWARLSGAMAVVSIIASVAVDYVTDWLRRHG